MTKNSETEKPITEEEILQRVKNEFGFLFSRFLHESRSLNEYEAFGEQFRNPGVYVFLDTSIGEVVKVGRSLSNAWARSWGHIKDNTHNRNLSKSQKYKMGESDFVGNTSIKILIFTIENKSDLHWICALEVFLEMTLKPAIPSGRIG
jgi:hypothetical protein